MQKLTGWQTTAIVVASLLCVAVLVDAVPMPTIFRLASVEGETLNFATVTDGGELKVVATGTVTLADPDGGVLPRFVSTNSAGERAGSEALPLVVQGVDGGLPVAGITYQPAAPTVTLPTQANACTSCDDADCTVLLAATSIAEWPRVAIRLFNSGAAPADNVLICFGTTSQWELWDSSIFSGLASMTGASVQLSGNSRRGMKIVGRAAAETTVIVELTASK